MKQIFINLPVADLEKSMDFYTQLGFLLNPLFTDENQKCMVWSEHIYVMLQSKQFANSHIEKILIDGKKYLSSSFTLPVESFKRVNEIIENGIKAGGTEPVPMLDSGFMQLRSIEDYDGYIWSIIYLDIDKFKQSKNS